MFLQSTSGVQYYLYANNYAKSKEINQIWTGDPACFIRKVSYDVKIDMMKILPYQKTNIFHDKSYYIEGCDIL